MKGFYYLVDHCEREVIVVTDIEVESRGCAPENTPISILSIKYNGKEVKSLVNVFKIEQSLLLKYA